MHPSGEPRLCSPYRRQVWQPREALLSFEEITRVAAQFLAHGVRKIRQWTARYRLAVVEWPGVPVDPFFNVNSPEDVAEAERLVATAGIP